MEQSVSMFPFPKLEADKYLTLEVLMFLEYDDACKFMLIVNKLARAFLETHSKTIRNGFINDGLIEYQFSYGFYDNQQLERLYFEALKRNLKNRILTLYINFAYLDGFDIIRWIRQQN